MQSNFEVSFSRIGNLRTLIQTNKQTSKQRENNNKTNRVAVHDSGICCRILLYPIRQEFQIHAPFSVLGLSTDHTLHGSLQVLLLVECGRGCAVGPNPHPALTRHAKLLDLLEDCLCVMAYHADQVHFGTGRFQLKRDRK